MTPLSPRSPPSSGHIQYLPQTEVEDQGGDRERERVGEELIERLEILKVLGDLSLCRSRSCSC